MLRANAARLAAMTAEPGRPRKSADERNAEARAQLQPLAPGERPRPGLAGTVVAFLLPTANLILMATGWDSPGGTARPVTGIVFALLFYALAFGMWQLRYGAVLAFEAFLGVTLVFSFLSLIVASNLLGAALSISVLGLGSWLFWKLIRVMGRIQATERQNRSAAGE